ncbi:MAG: preprotein translocase subunit SecG [Bacteroidaceae bacterium]|nr:preprotein translocase subunit SecG [Bacteroidaceae bacterium]
MYNLFVILVVIASILMCLVVLIQESKGGGLASGFATGNQLMGVRKTTDVIEKVTWGLAIAMVVFSVLSVYFIPAAGSDASVMEDVATQQQTTAPTNLPGIPATEVQETPAEAPADAPIAPVEAPEN